MVSERPAVSDEKPKRGGGRYAEWRWSPDTSPAPLGQSRLKLPARHPASRSQNQGEEVQRVIVLESSQIPRLKWELRVGSESDQSS